VTLVFSLPWLPSRGLQRVTAISSAMHAGWNTSAARGIQHAEPAAAAASRDDLPPRPTPPMTTDAHVNALVADISARLRAACSHMSDEEFSALVLDIATLKLRWADRERAQAVASLLDGPTPDDGDVRESAVES
jgi:hypothetical protein